MLYLETAGTFTRWAGEPIEGVRHPPNIEKLWSEAQLASLGLFKPLSPSAVPAGKRSTGLAVSRIDGVVKFVHTLEDVPLVVAKTGLINQALQHAQSAGQPFLAKYPDVEQKSFPKKEAFARRIVDGESDLSKTPMIQEEIALSGKSAIEVAERVLAKAGTLERIAGALSGFRQKAVAEIEVAADYASAVAALDAAKSALAKRIAAITS